MAKKRLSPWFLGPLALLALAGCEPADAPEAAPVPPEAPRAGEERAASAALGEPLVFRARELKAHAEFLASEKLQGRNSGTDGCRLARDYLVERFRKAGLEPAGFPEGGKPGWLQPFEFVSGVRLGAGCRLAVRQGDAEPAALALGQDYEPLRLSVPLMQGEPAALVFAGYGLSDPKNGYDDYAGLDVRDKLVIVLRGEPESPEGKRVGREEADPHAPPSVYSDLFYKVATARDQGARALLIVTGYRNTTEKQRAELIPFQDGGRIPAGLPIVHVAAPAAEAWFKAAGLDLAELQKKLDADLKPQSRVLKGLKADLRVDVVREHAVTENVLGRLPGHDPKLRDEIVVVGAHYDHLGLGNEFSRADAAEMGKKIHHGADDNASGVAVLLELARQAAAAQGKLRRTVWFCAFSGEELGTLGSIHMVRNPPPGFDVKRVAAMLNFDMVGRLREEKLNVIGAGTGTGFGKLLEDANTPFGFDLKLTEDGFGGSDHLIFQNNGVPVLFLFTGSHDDYHKPSDTADKLNLPGMASVAAFGMDLLARLAQAEERPAFVKLEPKARSVAGMGGIRLGTLPDYSFEGKGMRLSGVRGGGPAEKGGLLKGDVIVRLAGKRIENIYDFMNVLRQCRPDEAIEIVVEREGKEVTLKVSPEQKP
ncbi:MAG: M20/M25/M40 family metallo-hydrolase [Planctomycetota bacterium]|nr:M20/M25/M40 family metallo-hydrolase [Planctomycetota bacterium]